MATKWISPTWRMPEENNQSKFDNYSLDFGAGTDNITINSSSLLDEVPSNPFSFSFWFKSSDANRVISEKRATGTFLNAQYTIHLEGGYVKWYGGANGSGSGTQTSTTLIDNQWHHIVCVAESTTVNKIYVDGQLDVTSSVNRINSASIAGTFNIGSNYANSFQFIGQLSQYSIFDYALSETQIKYLYNNNDTVNPTVANPQNPMAIPGNTPVAYYDLGGSSTGDAAVLSPNTLTVPNSSVPSATVFDFNGSAYIDLNKVDLGVASTVSMWVNLTGTYSYALLGEDSNLGTYALYIDSSAIYFRVQNSTLIWYNSSDVTSGNWHNILITRSSSNQGELFIDGQSKGIDPAWTNGDPGTTSTKFDRIGARHTVLNSVQGEIVNVQAWNTDLDQPQITEVYNNGVPLLSGIQPQAANLKAWWKMNVDTSTWNGNDWEIGDARSSYTSSINTTSRAFRTSTTALSDFMGSSVTNFTWSMWVRNTSGDTGSSSLVSWSYPGSSSYKDGIHQWYGNLALFGTATNKILFGSINDGLWKHILIAVDLTAGSTWDDCVKCFINGQPRAMTSSTGTPPTSMDWTAGGTNQRDIGVGVGLIASHSFHGDISNYTLYNSTLGQTEATALYNNGTPVTTAVGSPTAWWKINNLTTGLEDVSGNSYNIEQWGTTQVVTDGLVSALNGTSDGMTTANLVTSDLTRSIPYSSYSMYMTGSTDDTYFDLATDIVVGTSGNTTYSWSIWVKPIDDGFTSQVVVFGDSGATDDGSLVLERSGGNFTALVEQTGTELESSAGAVVNNVWTHIAIVVDSTASTKKMYINGQEDTAVGGTGAGPDGTIKNINSSNTFNQYTGNVSNWAFWNSALSDDNILSIYNGGAPNDLTNLNPTHWWSMSGDSYFNGSNWICPDLIGSNNLTGVNDSGEELVGDGPGSEANGVGTSMNIPGNLQGNAPNSTANAFSINMNAADRVEDVAPTP